MGRSAFAKMGDVFNRQMTVVEVQKVVYRHDVVTPAPTRTKTDPALKRAIDGGKFITAIRALADFESSFVIVDRHWKSKSLTRTIEALRLFEQEYSHCRSLVRALPTCAERDCMMSVIDNRDLRGKLAWGWVIGRAAELDAPRQNKAARQQRRRNNKGTA